VAAEDRKAVKQMIITGTQDDEIGSLHFSDWPGIISLRPSCAARKGVMRNASSERILSVVYVIPKEERLEK
jgi:hypothetical protein